MLRIGFRHFSFEFQWQSGACMAAAVLLALAGTLPSQSVAVELPRNESGITGYFDTTVSAGAAIRTSGRKSSAVGVSNGGAAFSINEDDGNLNYDKGDFVSANVKVTHELQLNLGNLGFFGRGLYFYDNIVADDDTERTSLSRQAERHSGYDIELLDAYFTSDFDAGGVPVSVRVGKQVINWGERVFLTSGLNSINPVDVSKLRVAGAEVRDVLEPFLAANVKIGITDNLSLEGFYQFHWTHTEIEPAGTFFSTSDALGPGGKTVHFGFGIPGKADDNPGQPDPACPPNGNFCSRVPRASDRDADDQGQFGLALRYFMPALNDTELSFYYARIHSRLPLASVRAGNLAALASPTGYIGSIRYFREFPEDIDLMGASFNTEIGTSGFALQGEVSYLRDQPLQIDAVELFYSAMSPLRLGPTAALQGAGNAFSLSQTGPLSQGEELAGYRRKDIVRGSLAVTKALGPAIGANQVVFLTEAGFARVQGMESKSELRYEGPGTWTSANPVFTGAGIQPATQKGGFADPFSWGYRTVVRATYNNALGPVNLSPQIAFSHDVNGTSPTPGGNFVEDRKTITLSLNASYLHSWQARLSYTNSFSGGAANLRSDRDFLAFTANYSF